MVGLGTIAKGGGLLIAVGLGYVLLKNAGGIGSAIGSSVGGGLSSGFKGLTDSFAGAFDIFGRDSGGSAVNSPLINGNGDSALSNDGVNTNADLIVQGGGIPQDNKNHKNIAVGFGDFINSGTISADFAQKYSFQPPAQSGQLDVSNAFSYISSQAYLDRLESNNTVQGKADNTNYNYGGYGSATNQQTALAQAIAESASKYPEYYA